LRFIAAEIQRLSEPPGDEQTGPSSPGERHTTQTATVAAISFRLPRWATALRNDCLARDHTRKLPADAVLRVERPLGQTVACLDGSVWITFDGDCRDVILSAGSQLVCDRNTTLMVQALDGCAKLRIE
jgi:hypothetical protein